MALLIILASMLLAARSLYRHLAVSRVERAAPDVLAALIALRGNLGVAGRANSKYGRELLDQADAAIYKALGIAV